MRPSQVKAILEREYGAVRQGHHTPVMLWGPPGVGKSRIVGQVADRYGVGLIDLRLSQMEPTDLRGIPFRDGDRVEWCVPSLLPDAVRHGAEGILFLDEITSAPPTVTAAAYQLILDRRLGDYQVPAGWAIIAAGNRYGDRGVTYAMPAPLANRFTHYEVTPHVQDWARWALDSGVDDRVVAFIMYRPELLFEFDAAQSAGAFPSPRSWEYAHRALQKFADAPELLLHALQGCVGPKAAVEFRAFMDQLENLPDVDAILAGGHVPVPDAPDQQYGVAAVLIRRGLQAWQQPAAKETVSHILMYAGRFPQQEMGVLVVTELYKGIGRPLLALPAFGQWAERIADVMLYE